MRFSLAFILAGVAFTGVLAAPADPATAKQPEKRALTYAQALAGCKVHEKNKSIFWTNSKTSENAQDIADEFGDQHGLITMDEACEGVMAHASSVELNYIARAFAEATVNAGSTIAYAVLPDAGAGPKSMWIEHELKVLAKAKITLHQISLEHPRKAMTIKKLS